MGILNKKGSSHIEMILSFIIFIGFLVFMIIVLNPLKISTDISHLDLVESKILDNLQTELTSFSVRVDSSLSVTEECYCFDKSLENPIIVKDENDNVLEDFRNEAGKICFEKLPFYKVYSAEGLTEKTFTGSCYDLVDEDYIQGVERKHKRISMEGIKLFNQTYHDDYQQLKQELFLDYDFNFIIKKDSEIYLGEIYIPNEAEVMARTLPIEILDKDANFNSGILIIQVWE